MSATEHVSLGCHNAITCAKSGRKLRLYPLSLVDRVESPDATIGSSYVLALKWTFNMVGLRFAAVELVCPKGVPSARMFSDNSSDHTIVNWNIAKNIA